jgi:adenylate cyclase
MDLDISSSEERQGSLTSENSSNPSADAIREQLERILNSPEFEATEKMRDFLRFVVEETLSGHAGELKAYTIAIKVYGRETDFDASYDPLVRIQAGKLRRALERYYLLKGKEESLRIDIPRGTYVPVFISREAEAPLTATQDKELQTSASFSPVEPSIAVLPFKNLTGDPEKEYFVQGFVEELSIELTHYEDFHIICCHTARNIEEEEHGNKQFLQELGVHFLIEGSVRMDNRQVKISIKLTDTHTGELLWGEHYRRDLTAANLITVQEEIAKETVTFIASEYGIIPQSLSKESGRRKPAELDTYDAILRYYYFQTQQTPETFLATFQALEQAIINDPECGVATAMLASMYGNRYMLDLPRSADTLERAVELANKAVKLDPDNQLVRIIYAWMYFVLNEKDSFFTEIEKALDLNPNPPLRIGASGFYFCLYGEWERGKALLDQAMNQNTSVPGWYYGATTLYFYRLNDYLKAYEEALKYNVPGLFWGPMLRAASLGQLGREVDAQQELLQLKASRPDFENKAGELISRYVKEEELVVHVLEGLQKAGLEWRENR